MAVLHTIMRIRFADVISDLCAAKGKYHLHCWVKVQRAIGKMKAGETSKYSEDLSLEILCSELSQGLSMGNVYDMCQVWSQYVDVCTAHGQTIPEVYMKRRASFYAS